MSSPEHSSSLEQDGIIRKRVGRACDRCRLKKSKCDGKQPCSRCRADNNICVYGERKKSQDKVYPKGYVEMLEAQQTWLVNGLQTMYQALEDANLFPGSALDCEEHGRPLTHDILERLGALPTGEHFEEDCEQLLSRADTQFHDQHSERISSEPRRQHSHASSRRRETRSRSPDTDRSYSHSPPQNQRASFDNSPRTPPTPVNTEFRYWQLQQQGYMPEAKPVSLNTWNYGAQPLSDAQMAMWDSAGAALQGTMIPDLSMELDPTDTLPAYFDASVQSLVINPVALSNSSDSADFENFLNSGL